jgi:hypothetical protein
MMRRRGGLVAAAALGLAAIAGASAAEVTVKVEGNGQALRDVPIEVAVPGTVPPGAYTLTTTGNGAVVATVFEVDGKRHLAAVVPAVPASGSQTYLLMPGLPGAYKAGVAIRSGEAGGLDVDVAGVPFTKLVIGPTKPYFHPLIGPTGRPFTRAYPMADVAGEKRDHPHQRSFWITHGDVNGHDFWASDPINKANPKFGKIVQTGARVLSEGGAVGVLRTTNDWNAPDGSLDCRDVRTYRFWSLRSPRILDVDLTITAGDRPATFGDTKEGFFGLRVPTSMDVDAKGGGKITNAEGLHDADAWGKPSPWVDYTGPVDGQTVGLAILNRPDSFRYPTHWHVRTYGLFAANPFGYTDFKAGKPGAHTIAPGESIRFGYRVILHEGDTAAAAIDAAFAAYATPPKVTVSAGD